MIIFIIISYIAQVHTHRISNNNYEANILKQVFIFQFIFLFLFSFSVADYIYAQDTDPTVLSSSLDNKKQAADPEYGEHGDNTLGFINKYVSHGVLGAADRVDGFFGDNRAITDTNKTRIRFRLDLDFEQDESYDLSPNVFANISLPGTKKN